MLPVILFTLQRSLSYYQMIFVGGMMGISTFHLAHFTNTYPANFVFSIPYQTPYSIRPHPLNPIPTSNKLSAPITDTPSPQLPTSLPPLTWSDSYSVRGVKLAGIIGHVLDWYHIKWFDGKNMKQTKWCSVYSNNMIFMKANICQVTDPDLVI